MYKQLNWLAGIGLLGLVAPVVAHHSFQAVYDMNAPITVEGTVTKLEWMNPHIYYYVDVVQDDGGVLELRVDEHVTQEVAREFHTAGAYQHDSCHGSSSSSTQWGTQRRAPVRLRYGRPYLRRW